MWAIALLVVVFLGVGLWAEAFLPDTSSTAPAISTLEEHGHIAWFKELFVGA
jgi:hypothetical protein